MNMNKVEKLAKKYGLKNIQHKESEYTEKWRYKIPNSNLTLWVLRVFDDNETWWSIYEKELSNSLIKLPVYERSGVVEPLKKLEEALKQLTE